MKYFISLTIISIILLFACEEKEFAKNDTSKEKTENYLSPKESSKVSVSFSRTQVYGETEDVFFKYIGDIAVDDNDMVYIADKNEIKVFNPDGSFKLTIGGKGRGPGEFSNFGSLSPKVKNDRLYVYDDVLKRINVFSTNEFDYKYSIPIDPQNWNNIENLKSNSFVEYHVLSDTLFLVAFSDPFLPENKNSRYRKYFKMNKQGRIVSDQILKHIDKNFYDGSGIPGPIPPPSISSINLPSTRSYNINLDNNGNILLNYTEDFIIEIFDNKGERKDSIKYNVKKRKLDRTKIDELYKGDAQLYQRVKNTEIPKTWPVINFFFIDDNDRVWVSTITESEKEYEWWILNNRGEILDKFRWPGERIKRHQNPRQIKTVRNNFLYTREKDIKTDRNQIVRYKIEFNND